MIENGLAMTSASSLRTLGCIFSGPIDLGMFRFLSWSRAWSSVIVGRALPLWTPSCSPSTGEEGGKRLPVKTEAKNLLLQILWSLLGSD